MKANTKKIFEAFKFEMHTKLEKNNRKNPDRTDRVVMLAALNNEIAELNARFKLHDSGDVELSKKEVTSNCANISNFAMFVAYHAGEHP